MDKKYDLVMISVALVIAVIALAVSWSAYNKVGNTISTKAEWAVKEDIDELQRDIAIAQARTELLTLRSEIAAEEFSEDLAQEVDDIRMSLAVAFAGAGMTVQEGWQEVDSDLEQLAYQIREGSADSLETLNDAIRNLRTGIENPSAEQRCQDAGGEWTTFPNSCVDFCESQRDEGVACAQVLTEGCECGPDSCWNGITCEPV